MWEMITVKNLKKSFGTLEVLRGISFEVKKGDVYAAIGPSGSGKSTMLRCLIELEKADDGDIIIEGNYLCKDGRYVEKGSKEICSKMGMVFQHFNLFPHMTVGENLKLAPRMKKMYKEKVLQDKCLEMLEKVGLRDKLNESPQKLSGGQKQRVAIARALMLAPDIMLFDEPASALDPELTQEVLTVIKTLAKENTTMIVVTHEIGFAREAANKVLFMDKGVVVESGAPSDVIDHPKNERTIAFLNKIL